MKFNTTYLLAAAALAFTACQTDVTDKVKTDAYDGAAAISVSGAITDIDSIGTYLDLKVSSPYLSTDETVFIEGATVRLFDGDSLLGEVPEISAGRYENANFTSEPKHSYKVEIEVPSAYNALEGVWESKLDYCNPHFDLIVPFFPILEEDSTYYDYRTGDTVFYADADSAYYSPYIFFNDPAGEGNSYWVKQYWTTKIYAPNGLMGPFEPGETEVSLPASINIYNDEQYVEGPQIARYNFLGPPYTVYRDTLINIVWETRSISPELYDYLFIMSTNVNNGGLFSVPYSPQIGNIRRQDDTTTFGLGFFSATSIRFDSITMFHPF